MPGQYSQGQLDAIAREQGFPDYASWQAWQQKYRAPLRQEDRGQSAPKNWLQGLIDKIPIHPSYMFNHIADALRGVNERQE